MNGVMDGFSMYFNNGLRMGHHLTEARVALGKGSSYSFHDWSGMVWKGVGGGMMNVRRWSCCIIWCWMVNVRSGIFDSSRSIIWTSVWYDRCSCGTGNEEARDLKISGTGLL